MNISFAASVPNHAQSGKAPNEATIGEVAREYGVSLRTLRFYEGRGLLCPRRDGQKRFYGAAERRRLQAILKGKQFGFTLTEIGELIGAQRPDASETDFEETLRPEQIAEQLVHLERQRDEIEAAILRLREAHERRDGSQAHRRG
jgi:DNA-binding transcriptional MerR regulator